MLIALDLDDTLYLERYYVRSGFQAVDQWLKIHRSLEDFFNEAWSLFESGKRKTIFDMVLESRGLFDENLIKELVNKYRTHVPSITLEPDAKEFLRNHHKKEDLALITDGSATAQWSKIKALDIEKYFGNIIVTDDLGANYSNIIVTDDLGANYSKPNPDVFKMVQGSLPGSACVYIADNPLKDFTAPASLGWMPSIRVRRAGSLHYDCPTPDYCIEAASLNDVVAFSFLQHTQTSKMD
jgi:putative hydrolase of the HAD superfamily